MDSETFESGKDVDFNDSNINGTLYRKDNVSNIDFIRSHDNNIPRQSSTPSVSSSSSSASGGKSPGSTLPVPPDGGWGWVVVFASFMINFIADGVSISFGILFVDYFESTKAKTSWVGSIFLSMPLQVISSIGTVASGCASWVPCCPPSPSWSASSWTPTMYLLEVYDWRGTLLITYRGAMLNIHRYRLRASSCPDIYRNSMVTITEEKVIVGYVRDKPWINSSLLYSGFIAISGVSLMFLPMILNYYVTASLVGVYGFTISANYTLVPVIIVNLISLEDFTGAYGLLLLVQGIAGLIGPPVAGLLFNMTGNNDITFFCTGLCIVVSGIMVIPVAKTFKCGRKTTTVREDPKEPLTSRSNKVRFQEPQEKEVAIHFQAVPEEEGEL